MNTFSRVFAGAILTLSAIAVHAQGRGSALDATNLKVGSPLPEFTVSGIDGKKYLTKDLRNSGHPSFLYFINESDGVSRTMTSAFDRIVKAYQPGNIKVFGIINAREDKGRSYQSEFRSPYQLLLDPQRSTIQLLGVKSAPTVVMIDKSGNVGHIWAGYSGKALKEINRAMAGASNGRAMRFDFSKTPSATKYGTPYNVRKEGSSVGGL